MSPKRHQKLTLVHDGRELLKEYDITASMLETSLETSQPGNIKILRRCNVLLLLSPDGRIEAMYK